MEMIKMTNKGWKKEGMRHSMAKKGIRTKEHKLYNSFKASGRKDEILATFGPGKYYLGDICYVLQDDVYYGIWGGEDGIIHTPEGDFVVASTNYDDGTYFDDKGNKYGVDAGVIGLVPLSLATKENPGVKLGTIIEVKKQINFNAQNGHFHINWDGSNYLIIDTEGESEEQNEEEY
jgi:hypothetical protein